MPNVLLPVPHFEQSRDGACLPACLRMVLAYWGRHYSEAEIAKMVGTKDYGTPISNVERIRQYGYQVEMGMMTETQLKAHLVVGSPIIARVWTAMLDYWPAEISSHVVVIVGFDEAYIYLNDPALTKAPQPTVWNSFLAAWAEFDETAIMLRPP